MSSETAMTDLAVAGYTRDSAARLLARAQLTGAAIARGVRVTYNERTGYRVKRGASQRSRARR
jgi:hypothetical protein